MQPRLTHKVYRSFRTPRPRRSCTNCVDNMPNRSTMVSMNYYIIIIMVCYCYDSIYMHTLRHESNFVHRCLIHKHLVEFFFFTYIQLILKEPQNMSCMHLNCLIHVAFNLTICCTIVVYLTKSMYTRISWIILYYCYGVHVHLLFIRAF